jgi:ELWxxDGT repeat protein
MKYLLLIWSLVLVPLAWGEAFNPNPANGMGPTPRVVKDIFPGFDKSGSDPELFTASDNAVFFTAKTYAHGRELWRSNGANGNAVMVADLTPGRGDSRFARMVAMGTLIFFIMDDGVHGWELWRSDGTAAGTFLLRDIYPGLNDGLPGESDVSDWVVFGGQLYFKATDGVRGYELWRSNGTTAGTVLFKDINTVPYAGYLDSFPSQLTVAGGKLFFIAFVTGQGSNLWKSDGTAAGTQLVQNINPNVEGPNIRKITSVGSGIYFSAYTQAVGTELWKSDGTAAGTQLVKDIHPGTGSAFASSYHNYNLFTPHGSTLLFTADDGSNGLTVWRSDGTAAGTQLLLQPAPGGTGWSINELVSNGTQAWFVRATPLRDQVWRTDGVAGSAPTLLGDAYSGGMRARALTLADGQVFFHAYTDTSSGLARVSQFGNSPSLVKADLTISREPNRGIERGFPFAVLGSTVYFGARDSDLALASATNGGPNSLYGTEPWKCEAFGMAGLLKDIVTSNGVGPPRELVRLGNVVYFTAYDEAHGVELWQSDGTPNGTVLVQDVRLGPESSRPSGLRVVGSSLYFLADDGVQGRELWRTGSGGGAYLVKDIRFGPSGSEQDPEARFAITDSGQIYFAANDGVHGRELWRSDGTNFGTERVSDIFPGGSGSFPDAITFLDGGAFADDSILFSADDGVQGRELWKTVISTGTTSLVSDIRPGMDPSYPYNLTAVASGGSSPRIYFVANDGTQGQELWVTDGSPSGTQLVADIRPGLPGSFPSEITASGGFSNALYFRADDGVHGAELWRSEGNSSNTAMVINLSPNAGSSNPAEMTVLNGLTYFFAADGNQGPDLWKTDGTAFGTSRVWRNPDTYRPAGARYLRVAGQKLIFHTATYNLVWQSDGTTPGTTLLANLDGSDESFQLREMATTSDQVFLIGELGGNETDLFAVPILPLWEGWRQQHFGTRFATGNAADNMDPDGDGAVNLLERAFGLNPNKPDADRIPQPVWNDGEEPYFEANFGPEPGVVGLSYGMEQSSTLLVNSWQPLEPIKFNYTLPYSSTREKAFLRWRISAQ